MVKNLNSRGGTDMGMNVLKLKEDGVYLDDKKLSGVTDLKIDSSVDNVTVLDLKMHVIVENLDNLNKTK